MVKRILNNLFDLHGDDIKKIPYLPKREWRNIKNSGYVPETYRDLSAT